MKGQSVTEVLMVISWTESRRAVPRWQQILKCFVLTKLVQSNQPDTMINFTKLCWHWGSKDMSELAKVGRLLLSLSSSFHHIFTSDSTLMQLHLRHKYHWHLSISTVTFCCLSRLCFGSPNYGHFHTHTFLYVQLWQVLNRREWAGARKARGSWPWRYSPSAHTELFYVMI